MLYLSFQVQQLLYVLCSEIKKKKSHIISSFLLTTQQELIGKLITANAWESPKTLFVFLSLMVGRYFTISLF